MRTKRLYNLHTGKIMNDATNKYEGDLIAKPGVVYDYTEITGYLYARGADTKTAFPKLTTIGGSLDASGADTKTAFPRLTTIGGYLYASGADTKTAFPKLVSQGDAVKCRNELDRYLLVRGLILRDGILAHLVNSKRGCHKIRIVGKTKISFLIVQGEHSAHGDTLQLARADLLLKIGKRDTSAYKKWTVKTAKPAEEMIAAYRAITGACGAGVANFLNGRKYGPTITVAEAIKETIGQYGHDAFKQFFGKE